MEGAFLNHGATVDKVSNVQLIRQGLQTLSDLVIHSESGNKYRLFVPFNRFQKSIALFPILSHLFALTQQNKTKQNNLQST